MHLIREFSPVAYDFALASWSWLRLSDQVPRFASCFGDMFLESRAGWWFLDTVEGTIELRWRTMDEMFADLESPDGRAEYLLEETLAQATGSGMSLTDDEVFAFIPAPAITGSMDPRNLTPLRFAIAASLAGRIHHELRLAATPALPAAPTPAPAPQPRPAPVPRPAPRPATSYPRQPSPQPTYPGHEPEPELLRPYTSPTPVAGPAAYERHRQERYSPPNWSAPEPPRYPDRTPQEPPQATRPAPANPVPAATPDPYPSNPAPRPRSATPDPLPSWAPPSHVPPETTITGSYPTTGRHFA